MSTDTDTELELELELWTKEWYLSKCKEHKVEPKPSYMESEVPKWYPKWLRTYLTTVSRESMYGGYPTVVSLDYHDCDTVEDVIKKAKKLFKAEIAEYGLYRSLGEEYDRECDTNRVYDAALENTIRDEVAINIGVNGCTFNDFCDGRTGVIYSHCADDRDYGEVDYFNRYDGVWRC